MRTTSFVIGLAVALGSALLATSAHADGWQKPDGDNPAMSYGDISRVTVDHGPRRVRTNVRYHGPWRLGDSLAIYFDTRRGDPGPEFVLGMALDDTYGILGRGLARIDRFGQAGGRGIHCRNKKMGVTQGKAVWTSVPRRCLATDGKLPRRVRVSVRSVANYDGKDGYSRRVDWAPSRRAFGPWLRRG